MKEFPMLLNVSYCDASVIFSALCRVHREYEADLPFGGSHHQRLVVLSEVIGGGAF